MEQPAENAPEPVAEKAPRNWRRFLPGKRTAVVIVAVLGAFVMLLLADYGTSAPAMCASCHEIAPRAESWAQSPHAEVSCVSCHQPVTKWYQLPARLADRSRLLNRDVGAHLAGSFRSPIDSSTAAVSPVTDANCLQCHDPNRETTSGLRISINHAEHAKRNGSCISCHVRVAHPVEGRGNALSFMGQCFTCHGTGKDAKAPGECRLCHPNGYSLKPASHAEKGWKSAHGAQSQSDPKLCAMCHTRASCDSCHGVQMPHPAGWAKSTGHAKVAQVNRATCDRCHGGGAAMCTMCHHQGYEPSQGPWVRQHFKSVREHGTAYCFDCHAATFCVSCHAS